MMQRCSMGRLKCLVRHVVMTGLCVGMSGSMRMLVYSIALIIFQGCDAKVPLLILASVSQGRHNVIVSARVVVAVQVRYNGTSTRHSDRDMLKHMAVC